MASPIRELIEKFSLGHNLDQAVRLGEGDIFMVPSSSDPGGFYFVGHVKVGRKSVWVCSCKGFRYSEEDKCRHTQNVMELMDHRGTARSQSRSTGKRRSTSPTT